METTLIYLMILPNPFELNTVVDLTSPITVDAAPGAHNGLILAPQAKPGAADLSHDDLVRELDSMLEENRRIEANNEIFEDPSPLFLQRSA